FVNVSDQTLKATLIFDSKSYGLKGKQIQMTELTEQGRKTSQLLPLTFRKHLVFPPKTAFAFEMAAMK
ncbi:MAG: hypothetical protein NZ781_13205, partial [Armatimonadetes bacterium]|nr:hypothetical protein [Armatimonadota bacterium]